MRNKIYGLVLTALLTQTSFGQISGGLQPVLAKTGGIVLHDDFNTPHALDKKVWQNGQGTRWEIKDGELQGIPSTPEYQAARKNHKGLSPRIALLAVPQEYAIQFSFKLDPNPINGKPKPADLPYVFFDFGHHMTRLLLDDKGAHLLASNETVTLAEDKTFRFKPERRYEVLFELKGDDVVIQIQDGPTLRGKHELIAQQKKSFDFIGNGEMLHIDDLTVWSAQ